MNGFKLSFFILMLFIGTISFLASNEVEFSATEWNYGKVKQGESLINDLIIKNNSSTDLFIDIIPTCDCIFSEPENLYIRPQAAGTARLFFDTKDYAGEVTKVFILRTNKKGFEQISFRLQGFIGTPQTETENEKNQAVETATGNTLSGQVEIFYYYSAGCQHCISFLNNTIPQLEKKLAVSINVVEKDIFSPENFKEFNQKILQLGVKSRAFPALIIGDHVLQGEAEIDTQIEFYLNEFITKGSKQPVEVQGNPESITTPNEDMAIIPVIFAGLLDGVNPCAFSTLIFLLAYLAYVGRRKQEILIIGIFYTLTVFFSYFLIGLGFFRVLRLADSFPLISKIIEFLLMGVLIVFAGISLYDYVLIKKGRTKEIVLQLPDSLKQRIRTSIRTQAKSAAIILSSIILGFLVSVFELACTGQIYFPTIAYMIQMKKEATGYFYLSIYNIGFIVPLLIVFFLTYKGLSSKKLTDVFQTHMAKIKLVTAIFFLILAFVVILL